MNPRLIGLGIVALLATVLWYVNRSKVAVDLPKDGKRIGERDAYADETGFVPGNPAILASQAGCGIDVYALARLIASEATGLPDSGKIGVAWATVNRARRLGKTISGLLTKNGKFARQNVGGMYAATGVPPTAKDIAIAKAVYGGIYPDPTGGAEQWDSPKAQDALVSRGVKGYSKTADDVAKDRRASGMEMVLVSGVPERTLRFWRKSSKKQLVS